MTALIVILIIIAAVAVLLFIPLNLYISYSESKTLVWLRYLFITNFIPKSRRKRRKKKKSLLLKGLKAKKSLRRAFLKSW